jgi:hypothetical protein
MEKPCSRIDATALLRLKDRMRDDTPGPLWKKWAWFAGLWAAGVLAVGAVGWLLRWWLHP